MFTDPEMSIELGKTKAYREIGGRQATIQRQQYPFDSWEDICYWGNGVGCDGCGCPCHSENAPLFNTNEEVEEWHND